MYNEAIFTVSTSLPQQNISNYDTMENILDDGESVYHHATFYKSPQITPSFDVGESVYDHATTCGNDQEQMRVNLNKTIRHTRMCEDIYRFSFSCPWVTIFLHSRELNF
jgi:hypothetical protein